jgi:hypothetical protein
MRLAEQLTECVDGEDDGGPESARCHEAEDDSAIGYRRVLGVLKMVGEGRAYLVPIRGFSDRWTGINSTGERGHSLNLPARIV